MNSFKIITEWDNYIYYIYSYRNYNSYSGEVEYGACVMDCDTAEDIEDIPCKNETDAITEWARLVKKYRATN